MYFPPLIEENEYLSRIGEILKDLKPYKTVEKVAGFDSAELYLERYVRPENTANIVRLHGFTEFSEKYTEMIWYYFNLNMNVFIYDQRGHGFSHRGVDDIKLIHVSSFYDYVKDLDTIIENQVKVYGKDLPIYLFSHSMGGAVAALYVAEHPEKIEKSVMSSPMISPKTHNIPRKLVMWKANKHGVSDGWENRFPYASDFDPDVNFKDTVDGSEVRFNWIFKLRLATPEYQSASATNRWMWEALNVQDLILKHKNLKNTNTQVLILSAGNETVVKNKLQLKYAKKINNCEFVTIDGAKHNLFISSGEMLHNYYNRVFTFLSRR
ncbi:MAG: alpha/beta hydrolase [Clostridia bacterium]|nr:alpha/beta hydrolase [Clostridia bacterium]